MRNVAARRLQGDGYTILNRGRSAGSAASNAFQRTIRAPCDSKNARSSGVKNEEPSARRLNSRRSRPSGLRNLVRTSLMKNFQSASVHSSHSPFSRRAIRWKHTRCAVTRSNCLPTWSSRGKKVRHLDRALDLRGRTDDKDRENIRGRSLDPECRAAASDQARGPVHALR